MYIIDIEIDIDSLGVMFTAEVDIDPPSRSEGIDSPSIASCRLYKIGTRTPISQSLMETIESEYSQELDNAVWSEIENQEDRDPCWSGSYD